jgi:hypothetical protein
LTFKEFKKRLKDIFLSPPPKISWEFPKVAFEDLKRIFIEVLGNKRGELGVPKDKLEVLAETILPDIVAFFETEEGKRAFIEWKKKQRVLEKQAQREQRKGGEA